VGDLPVSTEDKIMVETDANKLIPGSQIASSQPRFDWWDLPSLFPGMPKIPEWVQQKPEFRKAMERGEKKAGEAVGSAVSGVAGGIAKDLKGLFSDINWQPLGVGLVLLLLFLMGVGGLLSAAGANPLKR
jgi:hypothetical protein